MVTLCWHDRILPEKLKHVTLFRESQ
jgi:hypothetical protein